MPTPRLPTALHIARGTYKKDPQRAKARENEPYIAEGIGKPPACFLPNADGYQSSKQKELEAIWHEFVGDSAPGVLNRSHRSHLETACRLKYLERHDLAKTGDIANLNKHITQMGMTPAAQSTVSATTFGKPGGKGAFASLRGKAEAARAS